MPWAAAVPPAWRVRAARLMSAAHQSAELRALGAPGSLEALAASLARQAAKRQVEPRDSQAGVVQGVRVASLLGPRPVRVALPQLCPRSRSRATPPRSSLRR